MSNIRTDYATFDVLDYKSESKLSSYNLRITPLTFKARIPNTDALDTPLNESKVTFDFGDGTFAYNLTSTHAYEYPGQYTVRMVLRDCNNNAILGSYNTEVDIHDYITNTFTAKWPALTSGDAPFGLSAGEFSPKITIDSQTPFYQDFQDIFFSVSASCGNFFNLDDSRYNDLKSYWSFYNKNYIESLSAYEYVPIKKVSLSSTNLYAQLSNGAIVNCLSSSLSSVLVGSSGTDVIYFKTPDQDNWTSNPVTISLFKDRNNIFSNSITGYKNNNYTNNFTVTLSALVWGTSAQTLNELVFSSNGITAESDEVSSFNVSPVQYKGLGIPFVITPKNTNNYTMKALSAGRDTIKFEVLSSTGVTVDSSYYTISSINNSLSDLDTDFWYRGLFTFNDTLTAEVGALILSAQCLYENIYSTGTKYPPLTASSTGSITLTCYPKNYYDFYKHNEDFDFEQTIKDLRFQEILLDKNIFFSDFIGTIFGDVSSNYDVLGKKLYEKIFNFTQNTGDIDLCGVNELIGLSKLVEEKGIVFDSSSAQEPMVVKRFLDILSINYNQFRGTQNKFDENFNPRGHTTKRTYGKNLGPKITDTLTYEITAGSDLVAYERFSDTYTRLNTYQPLCALSGVAWSSSGNLNTYMLSSFRTETDNTSGADFWGWELVLPNTFALSTVTSKYYDFYALSAVNDNTILNGLIDYTTGQTTVDYTTPLSSLEGDENIFDILIRNSLFSSLSLF
tara:strand:+ start:2530 stop:4725 length:2196 start_codon:yes stop_codon:yes gene_type:complete